MLVISNFRPYGKWAINSEGRRNDERDSDDVICKVYSDHRDGFQMLYGERNLPTEISFLSVTESEDSFSALNRKSNEQRIWPIYFNDQMAGFLLCTYEDDSYKRVLSLMNGSIILAFAVVFAFLLYLHRKILHPFRHFLEYPVMLSKGEITEKIPESKNRLFGKFVWGVNMLSDKLANDKKQINRLMRERQVLLTTIAHGIKTPAVNIKLYASAIDTGLYQPNGKANVQDAKIARKIEKNIDEITALVKDMLDNTSTGIVDYEPEINPFYMKELVEAIHNEFANRFHVHRIPYKMECSTEAIVYSDKEGIVRILFQILENAFNTP